MLLTLLVLYINRAAMAVQNIWKSTPSTSHEYLRDTLSFRYQECKSCRNRTELTCIKCGFCYSCHWKKEELEKKKKIQSKPLITKVKYSYSSIPSSSTKTDDDDDDDTSIWRVSVNATATTTIIRTSKGN